ncbi:glycoside hydrolase family 75 [Ilyonectria robusta]
MASIRTPLVAASVLLGLASARSVPTNVKSFYDAVVAQGKCNNVLAGGFYSEDGDSGDFDYCGDHIDDYNVVYLQGKNGALVNIDIDCDGIQGSSADDGRCGSSGDTQSMTSFMDTVAGYGTGQKDLDANIHPYVVFGNTGSKSGWATFDPQEHGIEPLSVMAVVCGDKLIYGVWGDENGDDGEFPMVGEASISLATACYGTDMNGNNGHAENDVLFIAFPGSDAVPGADGATWDASDYETFEESISSLGDKLIERLGGSSSGDGNSGGNGSSSDDCSWSGHCEGASDDESLAVTRLLIDRQVLLVLAMMTALMI